jgi:phage/plasmid-associated DNA primase
VKIATEKYRSELDDILVFVGDTCEEHEGSSIQLTELHIKYEKWCVGEGIRNPLGKNKFRNEMESRGFRSSTGSSGRRWFLDLRFKGDDDNDEYYHEDGEE